MTSSPQAPGSLRRLLGPGSKVGLVAAIAAAIVLLDQVTKALAVQNLESQGRKEVIGEFIQFQFVRNFAGPNNHFAGHTELISIFGILAALALVVLAFQIRKTVPAIFIGLLLGGAIGNLIDRIFREPSPLHGGVVDWLKLPTGSASMNVADLAIDIAIIVALIFMALTFRQRREEHLSRSEQAAGRVSS